jgi:hypothetical protein
MTAEIIDFEKAKARRNAGGARRLSSGIAFVWWLPAFWFALWWGW